MLEKMYTEDGRYIGVMRSRLDPIEPIASDEIMHYVKGYYMERCRNIVKARDAYGGYGAWLERVHPEWRGKHTLMHWHKRREINEAVH